MGQTVIVMISRDQVLIQQIWGISTITSNLDFVVLNGFAAAFDFAEWNRAQLVLIHQADQELAPEVERLAGQIAASSGPVKTLILTQTDGAGPALERLRVRDVNSLGFPLGSARLMDVFPVSTQSAEPRLAQTSTVPPPCSASRAAAEAPAASQAAVPTEAPILEGNSPATDAVIDQIRRVAPQAATILLGGEVGTGKTRLARQIHDLSDRRDEPFVVIHCGTATHAQFDRDWFGWVQGAFKGATTDRAGKFADAGRGTLFLDGVEALPLAVQTRLLQVLENRTFEPVGAQQPSPFQARLIVAANHPLDEEVAEGRFRSDLFFRLNVVGFQLPPLRDRPEAITPLAHRFLNEFAAGAGRTFDAIRSDALKALQEHDWPGNIRELRNVMAQCVHLCPGRTIGLDHLPALFLEPKSRTTTPPSRMVHPTLVPSFPRSLLGPTQGEVELALITGALEKHNNNRLRAAGELGISRMTLYKRLYKYGLMQPSHAQPGV